LLSAPILLAFRARERPKRASEALCDLTVDDASTATSLE
jgi:hypothetical protein